MKTYKIHTTLSIILQILLFQKSDATKIYDHTPRHYKNFQDEITFEENLLKLICTSNPNNASISRQALHPNITYGNWNYFTFLQKNNSCPKIKNLHFIDFTIEIIYEETFSHFPELNELNLDHNNIMVLSGGAFESLHYLEKLSLRYNHLRVIEKRTFALLESLEILDLSKNFLSTISEQSFYISTKNLITLNISYNCLKSFFNATTHNLDKMDKLQILDLSKTCQQKFQPWNGTKSLIELNLSKNNLTKIESKTGGSYKNLILVNLENNSLKKLDFRFYVNNSASNKNYRLLLLEGNDFTCKDLHKIIFAGKETLMYVGDGESKKYNSSIFGIECTLEKYVEYSLGDAVNAAILNFIILLGVVYIYLFFHISTELGVAVKQRKTILERKRIDFFGFALYCKEKKRECDMKNVIMIGRSVNNSANISTNTIITTTQPIYELEPNLEVIPGETSRVVPGETSRVVPVELRLEPSNRESSHSVLV